MAVSVDASKTSTGDPTYIGSGTFAQMKALASPADGAMYLVTNYGRGGSPWRYSSALSDWFPIAPCKVYENTGIVSGVAQLADQLLLAMPMEAGLLANKLFRVYGSLGKTGTTDASGTFSLRLGTAGTTADAAVVQGSAPLTAAARSVGFDVWLRMASATSATKIGGNPLGAYISSVPSSSLLNAAVTVASVASQQVSLSLTTAMGGTTDTPQVGYVAVEIQP